MSFNNNNKNKKSRRRNRNKNKVQRYNFDFLMSMKHDDILEKETVFTLNKIKIIKNNGIEKKIIPDIYTRFVEELNYDDIKKKVMKILSRIVPSNINKIKDELCDLMVNDNCKKFLMSLTFNRAISEEVYLKLYIQIFKMLITDKKFGKQLLNYYNEILEEKINILTENIEDNKDVHHNIDYDSFCKLLKNTENFKNIYTFICETYKLNMGIVKMKEINKMINKIIRDIDSSNNKKDNIIKIKILKTLLITINNKQNYIKYRDELLKLRDNFKEKLGFQGKFIILDIIGNFERY